MTAGTTVARALGERIAATRFEDFTPDVLRYARQHPVWQQVPFIVLTTSRQHSDIGAAYRLGVNSYIVKPVDFVEFAEVAKRIEMYWVLTNVPPFVDP